jgi:hypothetical protein
MRTYVQDGDVLDLDAGATVASGTGFLFGAALFGVALQAAVSGTASPFACGRGDDRQDVGARNLGRRSAVLGCDE